MDFNVKVDKKVQAEINSKLCVNCGRCRELCPTDAISEYQKTVACLFADCGEGCGKDVPVQYFAEAKKYAVETTCSTGCPLGIVTQAVAACIKEGDIQEAYQLISEKSPMPWICSQACDQFCRDTCKRGTMVDESLDMPALERFVLSRIEPKQYRYKKRFTERIAIIGGGPAGITAAFDLSKAGYSVTIFEREGKLGGAMRWGIPEFRLDKEKMREEIDRIISPGIEVRYNCNIGEDITLEQLSEEGFDAYLLATGTSHGEIADIPGVDGGMVYDAVDVMRNIDRNDFEIGENVIIIGKDSFALDMARLLVRKGKKVVCTSIESDEGLQLTPEEWERAAAEKIEFRTGILPKQIIREGTIEGSIVKAVEFVRAEYKEEDRTSILRPHVISGGEFNMFCDTLIFAMERKSDIVNIVKVETYPDGKVKIDDCHRTNKKMIFACGDLTGESDSVVEAMAAGRRAAVEIENALRNRAFPQEERVIYNTGDEETIYVSSVQRTRAQHQKMIIEGEASSQAEFVDDILPVLRSAGIEEKMPDFHTAKKGRKKVAIAGGGIAGITAAISLVKKGYEPTIFEKYSQLGGNYRWFTSGKRIDKDLLERELAKVEAAGIEVVYNATLGIRPSLEDLSRMKYDAVLFAIGESAGRKPSIDNADCRGVFDMVTLMGRLADNEIIPDLGQKVLITGRDEMALDIARLLNEYCEVATLMAPCSRGGLQVATSAVKTALDEGVNITTGVELFRINANGTKLKSVDFKILENKRFLKAACDTLVLGGTKVPDSDVLRIINKDLKFDDRGYMLIDDKLSTTLNGVFAIGDFNMSSSDAGRAGAAAIDNYLANGGLSIDVEFNGPKEMTETYDIIEGHQVNDEGFEVGRRLLSEVQAKTEASRCMRCGYHREDSSRCLGCGICVKACPADAISLIPIDAEVPGKWPNVKDIDECIDKDSIFSGEVE